MDGRSISGSYDKRIRNCYYSSDLKEDLVILKFIKKTAVVLAVWFIIALLSYILVEIDTTSSSIAVLVFLLIVMGLGIAVHSIWLCVRIFLPPSMTVIKKIISGYLFALVILLIVALANLGWMGIVAALIYSLISLIAIAITEISFEAINNNKAGHQ
jgi:hypothetical protein